MEPPSPELLSHLEGECEQASLRVNEVCAQLRADPGPDPERALTEVCAHLLNQCDRLSFYLLQTRDHPLYRPRYLVDFQDFVEHWPEYTANPSGFPSLGRLVELWIADPHTALSQNPPRVSRPSRLKTIQKLLSSCFTEIELRQWLMGNEGLAMLSPLIPASLSLDAMAFELVATADRHGLLNDAFFDALETERPQRLRDIARVRQAG